MPDCGVSCFTAAACGEMTITGGGGSVCQAGGRELLLECIEQIFFFSWEEKIFLSKKIQESERQWILEVFFFLGTF